MVTSRLPEVRPLLKMNEAQLGDLIIDAARLYHWRIVHFRPARTAAGWRTPFQGDPGFPDLVIAKGGVVLFRELKVGRGRLTLEQEHWRDALGDQWGLWTDKDLPKILRELRQ